MVYEKGCAVVVERGCCYCMGCKRTAVKSGSKFRVSCWFGRLGLSAFVVVVVAVAVG